VILELQTGKSLDQLIKSWVTGPLGIEDMLVEAPFQARSENGAIAVWAIGPRLDLHRGGRSRPSRISPVSGMFVAASLEKGEVLQRDVVAIYLRVPRTMTDLSSDRSLPHSDGHFRV
jgi:hypothetical protein